MKKLNNYYKLAVVSGAAVLLSGTLLIFIFMDMYKISDETLNATNVEKRVASEKLDNYQTYTRILMPVIGVAFVAFIVFAVLGFYREPSNSKK
ncbi:MAG: hypothetical protein U5L95_01455 [Candidatus Saccharibacteria bacterium]|nr:hypothetical protein [Candidatus Saccharibacteria bacterium]